MVVRVCIFFSKFSHNLLKKGKNNEIEESDLLAGIDASKMLEEGRNTREVTDEPQIVYRDKNKGLDGLIDEEEKRRMSLKFSKQKFQEDIEEMIKKKVDEKDFDEESNWESLIINDGKRD